MDSFGIGTLFRAAYVAILLALVGGAALGYGCRGCGGLPRVHVEWPRAGAR